MATPLYFPISRRSLSPETNQEHFPASEHRIGISSSGSRDADSEEADTHFRLGKAFSQVDMVKNAQLEYKRVLELNGSYNAARNELGWIYYNAGDYQAAFAEWQASLKINPRDSDAIFSLARGYNELAWKAYNEGKQGDAASYWKKVLTVDPENKAAKHYLGKQDR